MPNNCNRYRHKRFVKRIIFAIAAVTFIKVFLIIKSNADENKKDADRPPVQSQAKPSEDRPSMGDEHDSRGEELGDLDHIDPLAVPHHIRPKAEQSGTVRAANDRQQEELSPIPQPPDHLAVSQELREKTSPSVKNDLPPIPQPPDVPLRSTRKAADSGANEAKQPEDSGVGLGGGGQAEDAALKRMEQSMLKEANPSDLEALPKPKDIVNEAVGPVNLKSNSKIEIKARDAKLVVLARKNFGFPVISQFFNEESDFFQHGHPALEGKGVARILSNMLDCSLDPTIINDFVKIRDSTSFGNSPYFKTCLLASGAVCDDPLSYEMTCSKFAHQIMRLQTKDLDLVQELLAENEDLRLIYLVRDPRGIVATKNKATNRKASKTSIHNMCQHLMADFQKAKQLLSLFPDQFALSRYEVLAREPTNELNKVMKKLNLNEYKIEMSKQETTEEDEADQEKWSRTVNPLNKVNAWKQRLTIQEINMIEDECSEALSKLEYQVIGTQ